MRPLPPFLSRLIVPAISGLLLSSCFILAGYVYSTVYSVLFAVEAMPAVANDYVLPEKQIDAVFAALDEKAQATVDLTATRNPFSQH